MSKTKWVLFLGGMIAGRVLLAWCGWLIIPVVGVFAYLHKAEIRAWYRRKTVLRRLRRFIDRR